MVLNGEFGFHSGPGRIELERVSRCFKNDEKKKDSVRLLGDIKTEHC